MFKWCWQYFLISLLVSDFRKSVWSVPSISVAVLGITKRRAFLTNIGKTALIYSIITIYFWLRSRLNWNFRTERYLIFFRLFFQMMIMIHQLLQSNCLKTKLPLCENEKWFCQKFQSTLSLFSYFATVYALFQICMKWYKLIQR